MLFVDMAKEKKECSLESIISTYNAEREEDFISTGVAALDELFGGGINPGSMYCFWGVQGCGKSTLVFQVIRQFCEQGLRVAFIDVERAFNKNQQESFALREYVENGMLIHLMADNYSQIDEITSAIAKDGSIKLVVVDSETQLLPKVLDDVNVADMQPGQKARQAGNWLTKMKSQFYGAGIASIIIAHARANISMGPSNPYSPAEKQAGGYAMKHVPDVILKVGIGSKLKDNDAVLGQVVHLCCDKNKFAPPFRNMDQKLFFGRGVDSRVAIIDKALESGIISQNGAFFTFGDTKVRGIANLYGMDDYQYACLCDLMDGVCR